MSKFIEKKLEDIIDFSLCKTNDSKFTKTFINENKGNVPVYGASLDQDEVSYGYVKDNIENIKYFDNCLTWNIDGSTAVFYREGHFSLSEKVIPLILFQHLSSNIELNYLKYAIMFSSDYLSFDFSHKAGKGKLKKFKVFIPVNEKGEYDIEEQQRLVFIYNDIEDKKKNLLQRISELEELMIHIDNESDIEYKDVPLNKIVDHINGDAKYTKQWCKDNKGDFPVYSANNNEPISYINHYDYDGEYLTYSKNGCAGYISIINGKFSVNGDRCVMPKKEEFKDKVDIIYLKYFLEPIFRTNKKGRFGDLGKNEFTKLNSTMIKKLNIQVPIPIKPDGTFDLEKQKEIANKYRQIDEIKQGLIDKIKSLVEIKVVPSE